MSVAGQAKIYVNNLVMTLLWAMPSGKFDFIARKQHKEHAIIKTKFCRWDVRLLKSAEIIHLYRIFNWMNFMKGLKMARIKII